MKTASVILYHLLGVACIAADIAIMATLGQQDLSWMGWVAIAFYWIFAVRLAMGWKRLFGRPLRLILVGFYVMASLMLLGIGFTLGTSTFAGAQPERRVVFGLNGWGRWIAPTVRHEQVGKTFSLKAVTVEAYPWGTDPTLP